MKNGTILAASVLAFAGVCTMGGYELGKRRERRITNSMIESSFVNNFGALQSLRAGDPVTAIQRLENHAFMSATLLLNDPNATHGAFDIFRPDFLAYRHTHRSDPSEWSPMERKLEQLLPSTK